MDELEVKYGTSSKDNSGSGSKGWQDGSVHNDLLRFLMDGFTTSDAREEALDDIASDCNEQMDEESDGDAIEADQQASEEEEEEEK